MSTLEEFENAPVGSIAKKGVGLVAIREGYETAYLPWLCTTYGEWFSNEEMAEGGYTLVPAARPLPTREEIANALHGDNGPDDPDPDEYCSCGAGDYDRMGDTVLDLLKGQDT